MPCMPAAPATFAGSRAIGEYEISAWHENASKPTTQKLTVPREGANIAFDALLIPADAPHPIAAHQFLNFILEPKVIAAVTNYIHYANDNLAANPYVAPEILNDPALYPTAAMEARLYESREANPQLERLRTRTWTRIKTGL